MSLWLTEALVVSFFGIITLAVLGNALNEEDTEGETPNFNEVFIPIYIAIGFFVIYVIARAVHACAGCCNSNVGRRRDANYENDNDDPLPPAPLPQNTPAFNARRRAAAAIAAAGGGEFTDASEVELSAKAAANATTKKERQAVAVDTALDLVFAGLILAMFIVLAETLEKPLVEENFLAFFVLFYIVQAMYIVLLLIGAGQTYYIDHSPAGIASGTATFCGGVLCCCATNEIDDELLDEADAEIENNSSSSLARKKRYEERAEFQDRPCVYVCSPYAAASWIDWLFGVFLWLVPVAILASTILLQIYLHNTVENAESMTLSTTTGTAAVPTAAALSFDRIFNGRPHHIATFAPRIEISRSGKIIGVLNNNNDESEHPPATDPSGSTNNIDFGIVLLPIYIVLGILILHSFCLCASCVHQRRSAMEWLLGSIYIFWLGFLLWFFIELAERVDFGPREDELADDHEEFHELFIPLYLLFGLTLVIGACGFICLPPSYRPQRRYVSKWGVVVYRQ